MASAPSPSWNPMPMIAPVGLGEPISSTAGQSLPCAILRIRAVCQCVFHRGQSPDTGMVIISCSRRIVTCVSSAGVIGPPPDREGERQPDHARQEPPGPPRQPRLEDPPQPQPRRHRHGHGPPEPAAHQLHPQLVGLAVRQVHTPWPDHVLMPPLAVLPRTGQPGGHGTRLDPAGGDDGLGGTAVAQPRQDERHHRGWGRARGRAPSSRVPRYWSC
jgi:hypothetical protein